METAPNQRFKGGVLIVTGGSSGIGEGVVRLFCEHGAHVVFCSNVEAEGLRVQNELRQLHPASQVDFVFADVTKEADVKKVVDLCIEKHGRVDCLFNNVGRHPPTKDIDDFSADEFRQLFDLNVVSYFLFSKFCLPYLRKSNYIHGASIINNASITNTIATDQSVTYVSTKGAIVAMTRSLALDEAKHNVRVNSVSPGPIDTPLNRARATEAHGNVEDGYKVFGSFSILSRLGTTREVADAVLYFAAEGTYCTGINMLVSGGCELGLYPKPEHK